MMCIYDDDKRNDADSVDHLQALIRPMAWRAHLESQDKMPSSTSVSDISCEIVDGIPYFGGGRRGYECNNYRERDARHPDIDNEKYVDDLDEDSDDCGMDTGKYGRPMHCHDRNFADKFDGGNALVQDLLGLELRVAKLESHLTLEREARRESQKLVSMHEEAITLLKDEINALKLKFDRTNKRNDSLLKTNIELNAMLRKSDKVKAKRRKSFEGELVCQFPMDRESLPRRMSSESNGSNSIAKTTHSFDLVKVFQSAIMQPAESVLSSNDTRRIIMDSNEVYVPFPKERRRSTIDGAPLSSKHIGLLDVFQALLPRRRDDNSRSRDNHDCTNRINQNADDYHLPSERPNKGPGIFTFYSTSKPEQERVEPHESWAPADEINTQTELFNAKSMAKVEWSSKLHSGSTSFSTQTTSESTCMLERYY